MHFLNWRFGLLNLNIGDILILKISDQIFSFYCIVCYKSSSTISTSLKDSIIQVDTYCTILNMRSHGKINIFLYFLGVKKYMMIKYSICMISLCL